ncbi:MAG: nuclease-related domain-containing protein [Rhodospirillaceae bacterium]
MIFKEMDDKSAALAALERCLELAGNDTRKRSLIQEELRTLKAGINGEREAAYHIDFYVRDRKNSGVIHDLRIELADGRTAQIDHLLINRANIFYVLETKSFTGVKITEEGEFLRWNAWKKTYEGMASPLEQAKRHTVVLASLIESLGLPAPEIRHYILVSPKARIDRPKRFDTSRVIKADQFFDAYLRDIDNTNIFKLIYNAARTDPVDNIAQYIVGNHKPIVFNYEGKFGLNAGPVTPLPTGQPHTLSETSCRHCSSPNLTVEYGRFGYYFRCASCAKNTAIKLVCEAGHKERLRKEKSSFFRDCDQCQTSALYFTNSV